MQYCITMLNNYYLPVNSGTYYHHCEALGVGRTGLIRVAEECKP